MELPIAVASGFVLALLVPLVRRLAGRWAYLVFAGLPAALALLLVSLAPGVIDGEAVRWQTEWVPQLRLSLSFSLDGLSLLFGLLITGIGVAVILYAEHYLHGHDEIDRFHALALAFMASMLGLVLADDLLLVLVFWGLTGVTSYLLIGFEHAIATSRLSAQQALIVTVSGELAMIAGLVLLGFASGSFRISEVLGAGEVVRADADYVLLTVLILLGALAKSAQFPFHFWLPNAMAAPTPVSAYLHSATMVTAGVYLVSRLTPVLGGTELWTVVLVVSGGLTMLIGNILALRQHDLKLVLAYSTVGALGAMVMLVGLGSDTAFTAAMALLLAHALYKAGLFLVTGIVDHEMGTRELDRFSGLARIMPLTAVAAALGAVSMAGIPPMIGFAAKEIGFKAALDVEGPAVLVTAALVVAGLATVAVAAIASLGPFSGPLKTPRAGGHDPSWAMWLGPLVIGLVGVLAGLAPALGPGPLVAAAADAIGTGASKYAVEPWYGVDLALGLSVLSIALGVAVFWRRLDVRELVTGLDMGHRFGPEKGYVLLELGMLSFTKRFTAVAQHGKLRLYLLVVAATMAALVWLVLLYAGGIPSFGLDWELYPWEAIIAAIIAGGAAVAVTTRTRLGAVTALGVVGYGIALVYVLYSAPDLAIAQILVETLTVLLFVLAFYHMPKFGVEAERRTRLRDGAVAVAGGVLVTVFVLAASSTETEPVSTFFSENSFPLAKGRNVVNTIIVDFRSLDTLAEVAVLAIAGFGVYALLKLRSRQRGADEDGEA
ncbi:MAG: hydrogen gas-evolving membrane-bound hydrogenase subunit E [Candidatus Limnocylindrales bacterium]